MKRVAGAGPVTSDSWPADGAQANVLLELLRDAAPESASTAGSEQPFLAALRGQFAAAERRRGRAARWRKIGAVAVAAAALAAAVSLIAGKAQWLPLERDALSYRVSDARVIAGNATPIEASRGPLSATFSDGTVISFSQSTRARILGTTDRGARLRLESGRVDLSVVSHGDRGDWLVEAGPFKVRVTGTQFSVTWEPDERKFAVEVRAGHVIVEGDGQRRELAAGESFQWRVRRPEPRAIAPAPSEKAPISIESLPLEVPEVATPAPSADKSQAESWKRLVAAGRYQDVIESAEERGASLCIASCSLEELQALADAARLGGRSSLAERALLAQRARFADSNEAKTAAFLLGRMAESSRKARALDWYERYLAESPNGRFASDALGRRVVLLAGDRREPALGVAKEYLQRFPNGPYAALARSIIEASPAP
jgi:hypothetical protein